MYVSYFFIRLRQNTLQLAAGMNGVATRRSSKSEGQFASANCVLRLENITALIPRPAVAGLRGASLVKFLLLRHIKST